ncbi:avidin/streptavidin family protein [Parendozoicomonas sp. Alg238-R29]|uniref:avidin/streptavidin family protein n=1 Tax=Parendozoicomonas sp. Alg238-R29 TaxID=2993446 RepID=UPI00248DE838|nr:avidin/streptavidin family protein [Parendozoicomonas sp. Alg238-R29]
MKLVVRLLCFALVSISAQLWASDVAGRWKNQYGSTLEITDSQPGHFTGVFTTAVAVTPDCIGYPAPLEGVINGNAIALNLNMAGCTSPSVIAMTGIILPDELGRQRLQTQALVQFKGQEQWNSQILSTSFFYRDDADTKVSN